MIVTIKTNQTTLKKIQKEIMVYEIGHRSKMYMSIG